MKQTIHILALGLAATFGLGQRATANAAEPKEAKAPDAPAKSEPGIADLQKQINELKAANEAQAGQIEAMRKEQTRAIREAGEAIEAALKGERKEPQHDPNDEISLLARGAGVKVEDVRWRVRAGLSAKQAVEAALAQVEADKQAAAAAEEQKKKASK